jgi:hypothetical protein
MALTGSFMRDRTYAARVAGEREGDAALEGGGFARRGMLAHGALADLKAGGAAASRDARSLMKRASAEGRRRFGRGLSSLRALGAGAPSRR